MSTTDPQLLAVAEALAKLAAAGDPDAVAQRLEAAGATGPIAASARCPIATYVRKETGLPVAVGVTGWAIHGVGGDALPDDLAEFVQRFDRGHYPTLERRRLA